MSTQLHIERLERTLAHLYDADACAELVRLYLRQNQPITAWRFLKRVHQEISSPDIQSQLHRLESQCKLIIIEKTNYTRTINAFRSNRRIQSGYGSHPHSYLFQELPRSTQKRAIIFTYAINVLDPDTPKDIDWLMEGVLNDLALLSDHCHMRRYMLSMHMLQRTDDGSRYWINPQNPVILI